MSLGWKPKFETIVLSKDADYIDVFERRAGDWPTGTFIRIYWKSGATWPATIAGNRASWKVEAAEAALIPNNAAFEIRVSYPDGGEYSDYVWFVGRCRRTS